MKKYLYLVRHGETDWNSAGKVQGREDIELNEKGIAQARSLAEVFHDVKLDAVVSSPLKRARKTAQMVAEDQGLTVIVEPGLIERDYGALSGCPVKSRDKQALFRDSEVPGMEPMEVLSARMMEVLKRYAQSDYERVLMVSHGAAIKSVLRVLSDDDFSSKKIWLVNACINVLSCQEGTISIERLNLSHEEFFKEQAP